MIETVHVYDPPSGPYLMSHGDVIWHFVRVAAEGTVNDWAARDWRANARSHQRLIEFRGETPYNVRRRNAVLRNRRRRGKRRTIDDLRGAHVGRPAYLLLGGPSAIADLKRRPPRPDEIVIGYNRAYTYWPLDYLLVADAIVDLDRHREWGLPMNDERPKRLIAIEWTDPSLVASWCPDDVYWFRQAGHGEENTWLCVDQSLPELEFILSGGTMLPHFADVLGCNPIYFAGCNFAVDGTQMYAGVHQRAPSANYHFLCHGIDGRAVWTTWEMWMCAKKLEAWAYIMRQYGVRWVNLAQTGLLCSWYEHE